MGSSPSKPGRDDALLLCKERMRHIKRAVESRDALSAAHLTYTQSLRRVGTALRRYAESEISPESSLSISEVDKSPSHSSYASPPSPSRGVELPGSPLHERSPLTPPLSKMSYMKARGSAPLTITIDPLAAEFAGLEPLSPNFVPPPPPPPPELCSSWDFFDPADASDNASSRTSENGLSLNFSRLKGLRQVREAEVVPLIEEEAKKSDDMHAERNGSVDASAETTSPELPVPEMEKPDEMAKELCAETEDASEFITHRAKDFVSSMKEIEYRFIRAAEAGHEVSRMLETKKIRLDICGNISGSSGRPPSSRFLTAFHPVCCNRQTLLNQETAQRVANVITWKRSISSLSSSSKSPLTSMIKDDGGDNSSDFVEQFSMVSGSHSSTLDRLYAWERKLHDEIKASEHVRKAYDQKCTLLRHQFARGLNAQLIDKTRAVVKDLHSRVSVAIQAVDAISKRIEKLRDEELQPQLVELIQGLIRMWKAMLECHHAQFITISLAYHVKSSTETHQAEPRRQALMYLWNEMDYFGTSFMNWIGAQKSYMEALNAWLQKCILQPQDHRRRKRKVSFPPRHALSPPIFVLCSDWLAGVRSLPSDELCESIKSVLSLLRDSFEQQPDHQNKTRSESQECGILENNEPQEAKRSMGGLEGLQASFTRVFDRLTKFTEASLKLYEELKQGYDMARIAYKAVASDTRMV